MLKLSKKVDYGLLFLTALARRNGKDFVSLKEVAEKNDLPYKFIGQVASELNRGGIVASREGIKGGYRLAKKPFEISVGEVVRVLEGKMMPVACMRGKECKCEKSCGHKSVVEKMALKAQKFLESQTIEDLC